MSKSSKSGGENPRGVREIEVAWVEDHDLAETRAALEEYRRTGVSYEADEVLREFVNNVRVRSAGKR